MAEGFQAGTAARVIDGRAVAAEITARVGEEAEWLRAETGVVPGLAVVLVGDHPASQVYVRNKSRTAAELGFHSAQHNLPADTSEADLLAAVERLNRDKAVHGILVQLPLPPQINPARVIEAILPEKDVDGFHPINVGRLVSGSIDTALIPCTPAGCLILLRRALGTSLAGCNAVVIGRSNIVGKPVAHLLLQANATVTIAHSQSRDLADIVRRGDIVVAAVGRAEMVRGSWIKPGSTIIDVGMNRIAAPEKGEGKTRLVGDVAYEEAAQVAAAITPVPGGVGPMTIAMLMANTLVAAYRIAGQAAPTF